MTRRRRIFVLVGGVLLIPLLLIILLLVNINKVVNQQFVHKLVLTALSKPYNGKIKTGRFHADLKEFSAEGWDVVAEDDQGRLIGKAPYAKVWFNRWSFFWRRVRLERVELESPYMHLWTDTDGVFIFKKWKRPPRSQHPIFRTRAGILTAHNGTFIYDYYPPPKTVHIQCEGINARAKFNESTPYIQGTIDKLYLKYDFFDGWFYNLTVQGIMASEFAEVHKVTATYLNLPLTITGRLDGFQRKNPLLNLNLRTAGKIGDLLRYFHYNKMPPGEFTLNADITGYSDDYSVTGFFTSIYGIVEGQRYDNLKASFIFHKSVVNVERFTMRMYGMDFVGSGTYNVSTGDFHFSGTMTHRGRPMRFDVLGRLDTQKDLMTFSSITVSSEASKLEAKGRWYVGRGTLDFNYQLIIDDMANELTHWGAEGFGGKLDVSGDFTGTLSNPLVTADGQIADFEWKRAFLGTGPFKAELRNGDITVEMAPSDGNSHFKGTATIPFMRHGDIVSVRRWPLSFEFTATDFPITKKLMTTDFTGVASGRLAGGGTIENLRANGDLTVKNINAWGQSIAIATADLEMTEVGITFDKLKLKLPSGDVGEGRIWMDWDLNYKLSLQSDLIRLSSLNKVQTSGMPLEGRASLNATGEGNFEDVKLTALVDFHTLTYGTLDLMGGQLTINLRGAMVDLQGGFYEGTTVNGKYDFNDGTFHNFVVTFNKTPLGPILIWKNMPGSTGSITGNLTMNGGAAGWGDVDYSILLTELELRLEKGEISNSGPLRMELGPSGGKQDIHLLITGGQLDITGVLTPDQVWDLDAVGNFDLGVIAQLNPRIRSSSGATKLNAHIQGPSSNIKIAGFFELEDGAVRFRGYQGDFTGISGRVVFQPDRIEVERLAGIIDDEGDFAVEGDLNYEGFTLTGFNMKLEATGFPYSQPGVYRIVVSPSLTLTGTMQRPRLSGRVQVVDGRYTKDVKIDQHVIEITRETAPRGESEGFADRLRLNLEVVDDGNFRINNNLADVYLRADLTVRGTLNSPSVEGSVEGVSGKIYYLGTAFEVVKAQIQFDDPTSLDPLVDVSARADIRNYEIDLTLKGRLSHMLLTLDSIPTLDEQNIMSLLTFRRLSDELTQNESEALLALPMFFAQQFGGSVRAPLEKYSGINILQLETQEDRPGARAVIGIQRGKRLTIQYSQETTGLAPIRQVQAIYRITDNIWLQGTQNNLGVYSFKLNFHFEAK